MFCVFDTTFHKIKVYQDGKLFPGWMGNSRIQIAIEQGDNFSEFFLNGIKRPHDVIRFKLNVAGI